MKLLIQAKDMSLTQAIRKFTANKSKKLLKKFGKKVIGIRVYLENIARKKNDPQSAQAKVQVEIPGDDVVVESKSNDAYQAITKAINLAVRSLKKIKGKQMSKRR
jgi:ribosomal subunit interface protein